MKHRLHRWLHRNCPHAGIAFYDAPNGGKWYWNPDLSRSAYKFSTDLDATTLIVSRPRVTDPYTLDAL